MTGKKRKVCVEERAMRKMCLCWNEVDNRRLNVTEDADAGGEPSSSLMPES